MTQVLKDGDRSYEKVHTDEKLCDDKRPLTYGYGFRHVQCIIFFISLCSLFIGRAHLSVTIVAMTDAPKSLVNADGVDSNTLLSNVGPSKNSTRVGPVNENEDTAVNNSVTVSVGDKAVNETLFNVNDVLNKTKNNSVESDNDDIRDFESEGNETNKWNVYRTYSWPKATQELVLGAFFLGYTIMMLPMGVVAQRFGGKLPLQIGLFSTGVLSFITPWLAFWGNYTAVCLSRVAMGLLQAGTFPSLLMLVAKWVPVGERGRLATYTYLGSHVGSILSYHVSGILVASRFGWPSAFWVAGVLCIIMAIVLTVFVAPTPTQHRLISQEEKNYIIGSEEQHVEKKLPTPWRAILTSRPAWVTFIAHLGGNNYYLFFFTQIPTYMHFIVGFDIKSSGLLSSLPYLANLIFSVVIGNIVDYVVNRKTMTIKQVRIISNSIANVFPAVCLIAVSFTTSPAVAVVLLVLCMGTHGASHTGWMLNYIDLSPNFSSAIMATGNTISNLSGLMWPVMISFIVTDVRNVYQWRIMLFVVAMLALICNAIFVTFMSADVQPWNDIQTDQAESDRENESVEKEKENDNDNI